MSTKWAVNAANRFTLPRLPAKMFTGSSFETAIINVEKLHAELVALQLRAYRRGVEDTEVRYGTYRCDKRGSAALQRSLQANGTKIKRAKA